MDNGACSYRRFLDGEELAFDEIIKEYRNGLTYFILRYVHSEAVAEDIAVDVFMDLLVHPHRYNFRNTLKSYLYLLGRCKAIDYLRHQKKLQMVELTDDAGEPEEDALFAKVFSEERKRVLHQAIGQLPADMREAVHLVYFEELSYEEAAAVMRKKRKQVDNLLYRAKTELRTILGEEGRLLL